MQEQGYWCWAAAGALLMNYVRPASAVTQCDEANRQYGDAAPPGNRTNNCCAHPETCNFGGYPQYEAYHFKVTTTPLLDWDGLRKQLGCRHKPLAFVWDQGPNGKHMMVAVGYKTTDDGVPMVLVNDPYPPGKGDYAYKPYQTYVGDPFEGHQLESNDYDPKYTGP